tara:strand:- start:446 stop:664 length:219 start_codon:yes stop_codon:yes gene_type:complete
VVDQVLEDILVDQPQVVMVVLVVEALVVVVRLLLDQEVQELVVKDFQVERVLLILVQVCNKVVAEVVLVLLV